MQPDFWRDRWRAGQIGFHQPAVDRNLEASWQTLDLRKEARVFVPLCGKSLDMLWLRDRGHAVCGVELSDIALQAFCMENGIPARRRAAAGVDSYVAPGLELLCGDIFALTAPALGKVDAIYDRAALVSFAPQARTRYVEQLIALTPGRPVTLLITLEYPQLQMAGPPFSVTTPEIGRLYGPAHDIVEIDRRDVTATEHRMRARGVTRITEVCYRLVRR
ncbi:MAG: thiopurine S-methyltransferase [Steroidobacteraceae bacterium]